MGMKILRDGENFGDHPSHFDKSFGFTASHTPPNTTPLSEAGVGPAGRSGMAPEKIPEEAEAHALSTGHESGAEYAGGGHVHPHGHHVVKVEHRHDGAVVHHHAHGGFSIHHQDGHITHHHADGHVMHHAMGGHHMGAAVHTHPHGHSVTHSERHGDREIHHHEHGGYTVHHDDGRITHHHRDGSPLGHHMMAHGGAMHGDGFEPEMKMASTEEHARGGRHMGDLAQDKAMVAKGVHQHEDHEHGGEHTALRLAGGGMMRGRRPHLPKPKMGKNPLTEDSALNRAPRRPEMSTTPRNAMPGGQMPYGVEPSAEPDMAGSGQDIPQLKGGGRARR